MTDAPFSSWSFPLLSTGSALPRECVSNAALVARLAARGVETSEAWISERTGIEQRYFCGDGENVMTLARDATVQALDRAGLAPGQVDVLVVATCTPNGNFPSVAAQIQGALGLPQHCVALDVNAACSGFVHALAVARGLLAGMAGAVRRHAVIVGAEQFSKILDFDDRSTCVLFGDGAGAVVMGAEPAPQGLERQGLLAVSMGTDGTLGPALCTVDGYIQMNGREVYKHAVRQMGQVPGVLADAGLTIDDVAHLVPHQANVRILEAAAKGLGLDSVRVVVTVDRHANTSAASIPLALDVANGQGRLRQGDVVLLEAFGAGFVWGEAVLRW